MPEINYPRAPDPPKPYDPLQALELFGRVNALQQFQANRAVGEETQRAIKDGKFDPTAALRGIAGRPDAALAAPEATSRVLSQQGQGISNTTAQYEQDKAQTAQLHDLWGAMADKPKLTGEDLNNWVVGTARRSGIPAAKILDFMGSVQAHPGGLAQSAKDSRALSIGSAGTIAPEQGPPETGTGAPTVIRRGAANQGPMGGFPVAQPAGEPEAQQSSAARGAALRATAGTSPQIHTDLENLKHESRVLGDFSGPTSEAEKKLNSLSQRVFGAGITLSKDQLAAADSFDKIVSQIATNQSKTLHGSDASLSAIQHANPNLQMSAAGRDMVIDMLHGNQDAIDVTRKAWADARAKGVPMHNHDDFMEQFSRVLDPRVFQFNRLSRENQQKFLSQMDPAEVGDFEQKYQAAIDRSWVKPLKKAQ